jgi:hypothetical protein
LNKDDENSSLSLVEVLRLLAMHLHEGGKLNLDEEFVGVTFASAKKGPRHWESSPSPYTLPQRSAQADALYSLQYTIRFVSQHSLINIYGQ